MLKHLVKKALISFDIVISSVADQQGTNNMTINLKEGHVKLIHCFKMDPNVNPLPGIYAFEGCFAATILLYPAPT